jgi:hypothetical protein
MPQEFSKQLVEETQQELAKSQTSKFAIIGHTPVAYDVFALFRSVGAEHRLLGIYDHTVAEKQEPLYPLRELGAADPEVVVVAGDAEKEQLLRAAEPHLDPAVRVVIAGYQHFEFRNLIFDDVVRTALVPSLANGYPNSLIHIFQCLENASRLKLQGVVAEFGIFKGGTTMMLSRFIERLGQGWKVIGFDTFDGFPPKRSLFDMYDHPDCVFSDEQSVRHNLSGRNVEIIRGDLVETVGRLASEDVILAFFDTDNYASTTAILDVIQDRVVVGGALVFDHFTGKGRLKYTIGERLAAMRLLDDDRYFHLHDTGVFYRQR